VIQASQRSTRLITIVAAAAILDPGPFAALALGLALTDLVRSTLLAYDVSAVRLLASGTGRSTIIGSHLAAKMLVALIGTLAITAFSELAYGWTTTLLVVVASVGTFPASASSLLLVRRQVEFRLGSAAPTVAVGSSIGAAVAIGLLLVTHDPIAASVGLVIGDLLVFAALSRGLSDVRRTSFAEVRRVIARGWTLLLMQVAYVAQFRVGTIVLGAAGATVAVAEYTLASRMAEGMVILAAALTASSFPLMGAAHARGDQDGLVAMASRAYRLSLVAVAPLMTLLALTSPLWVAILFPRYPDVADVFLPIALTVVVYFASSQTTAFLNGTHRDRVAALSAGVGVVVAVTGSWLLVAVGALGAAVARLTGELVRLAIETGAIARMNGVLVKRMASAWIAVAPFIVVILGMAIAGRSALMMIIGFVIAVPATALTVRQAIVSQADPDPPGPS
jgi:O-antigen/teichoic acid export membrane protein